MEEEVESTRGEKILATSLVVFLFIGGVRILLDINDVPERPEYSFYEQKYQIGDTQRELMGLYAERDRALSVLNKAQDEHQKREEEYIFRREEYRITLEQEKESEEIKKAYEEAKEEYEIVVAYLDISKKSLDDIQEKISEKEAEMNLKQLKVSGEYDRDFTVYQLKVLGLRFTFAIPVFVCALVLFMKMKKTKYGILFTSLLASSVLLLLYMMAEYAVKSLHLFGTSLLGALSCAVALIWLKREYYSFERISKKRIEEGKCPWCQAPVRGRYCYSCGKLLEEVCPHCGEKKPVFTKYCLHCGNGERSQD